MAATFGSAAVPQIVVGHMAAVKTEVRPSTPGPAMRRLTRALAVLHFWNSGNRHKHPAFARAIRHLLFAEVAWALHFWYETACEMKKRRRIIARVCSPQLGAAFFTWLEGAAICKSEMASDPLISIKLQLPDRQWPALVMMTHPREKVSRFVAAISERTLCPRYSIRLILGAKVVSHHKHATLESLGVVEGKTLTMVVIPDRATQRLTGDAMPDAPLLEGKEDGEPQERQRRGSGSQLHAALFARRTDGSQHGSHSFTTSTPLAQEAPSLDHQGTPAAQASTPQEPTPQDCSTPQDESTPQQRSSSVGAARPAQPRPNPPQRPPGAPPMPRQQLMVPMARLQLMVSPRGESKV